MNTTSDVFSSVGSCLAALFALGIIFVFPVWVAIRAYNRGSPGWMIATLLTIPLGLAPLVAFFALIAMPSTSASLSKPTL